MSVARSGDSGNVHNLEERSVWEIKCGKCKRRTLQMSDAVKAMVKDG